MQREDNVFFRCDNRLSYGGQVVGESDRHTFYLNGDRGPIGSTANAPLAWDENRWDAFAPPGTEGRNWRYRPRRCQPFLLRFENDHELKGRYVDEHAYYVALGDYRHLLPSTDDVSGLTRLSPGEADHLRSLIATRPDGRIDPPDDHDIAFVDEPLPYDPAFGPTLSDVVTLDELVAVALVNPGELPAPLRPRGAAGHYVPISPYRRRHVDRVEIGCYTDRRLLDGTLPDRLVYLSLDPAGAELRARIDRQFAWLEPLLGDTDSEIDRLLGAPEFEVGFGSDRCQIGETVQLVNLPEP